MPWSHVTLGAFRLEHKERYDIIIGEEWYMLGLQQVPRTFYGAIYSEHVCISHYEQVLHLDYDSRMSRYRIAGGSGKYIRVWVKN